MEYLDASPLLLASSSYKKHSSPRATRLTGRPPLPSGLLHCVQSLINEHAREHQ